MTVTPLTADQYRTLDAQHGEQINALDFIVASGGHIDWLGPHFWTAGANLAQWGAFKHGEQVTRDIAWILRQHENSVIADPNKLIRNEAFANRFDY